MKRRLNNKQVANGGRWFSGGGAGNGAKKIALRNHKHLKMAAHASAASRAWRAIIAGIYHLARAGIRQQIMKQRHVTGITPA